MGRDEHGNRFGQGGISAATLPPLNASPAATLPPLNASPAERIHVKRDLSRLARRVAREPNMRRSAQNDQPRHRIIRPRVIDQRAVA
jgi:hypothetical protein